MIGSLQLAAAVLLMAAGAGKVRAPRSAAAMLQRSWLSAPRRITATAAVRTFGVVEVAVGALVCATGSRVSAALLAGCYFAFVMVATRLLRHGQRGSCGCFGDTDSPIGIAHVLVNCAGLAAAITAFIRAPGPVGGLLDGDALIGAVGVGQAVLLAYLAFLSITALPALVAARRRLLEPA